MFLIVSITLLMISSQVSNTFSDNSSDRETFFAQAPELNLKRISISGVICHVRIEEIEDDTMHGIRYFDKLIYFAFLSISFILRQKIIV